MFLAPLAALAWVTRGLLRGELYFERDQALLFLPLKRYVAERLRAGELPDWWPWDGLGQPLAAIPVASVFHPSTAAYLALPFEWAYAFQALLPFPVALLGAFALARALGLGPWLSALAATAFTCGFYFVALSEQTQMHLAAMSLPWAWREALRVARLPGASWWGLSLSVANLLLGGDPMLLELAALGALPLVLALGRPRARVPRVAAAAGLGVGLGAVQWVPMLFAWSESPRSAGLGIDVSDFWALRWEHVAGVVAPGSFAPETFLFETTYVGVTVLGLAALGVSRRWRWRWALLGIVVVGVALAVGRAGGAWSLFAAVVPGWKGFQFPAKTLGPALLALVLLAARGAAVALRRPAVSAGLLAVLGVAALAVSPWSTALVALAFAGLVGLAARGGDVGRRVAMPGFVVLVAGELLLHGARIDTLPWREYREPAVAQALRDAGVGLGGSRYLHARPVPRYATPREGLELELDGLRPASGAWWGLPTSAPYLQGFTRRYFDVALADKDAWLGRRATLFATNTFILAGTALRPEQRARVLFEDPATGFVALRASRSLPLASLATDIRRVPEQDTVAALSAPGFIGSRQVLVPADGPWATPPEFEQRSERPLEPVQPRYEGEDVLFDVTTDRPAVLLWNEAFTEATQAFDGEGQPLVVLPANHAAIGVPLPPGQHRVRLVRRTPGVWEGLGLGLAAALALLGLGRSRGVARSPA